LEVSCVRRRLTIYYFLSRAIKRRIIHELRDSFGRHYQYAKITASIQDKFAYKERPQYGIVVKNVSASKVQLSADNFLGHVSSHVQKANIEGKDGSSIEWIREDTNAILNNTPSGTFPSPQGTYYVNWESDKEFMIDPLLSVEKEFLVEFEKGDTSIGQTATVSAETIYPGTLFLFTDEQTVLVENSHYSVNYDDGIITFLTDLTYHRIYADYHYPAESRGPYVVTENSFNHTAIPGVIIAFGRNMHTGDGSAIIVTNKRTLTALEYGGNWEISISFDVLSRDPRQMEEIADLVLMFMWGEKKNMLEFEGIHITDISHGGEADEVYDETGQDMYYMVSMDMALRTDWSIHVPVPFKISAFSFVDDLQAFREADEEEVTVIPSTLQVVPSLTPYMSRSGMSHNFERIV